MELSSLFDVKRRRTIEQRYSHFLDMARPNKIQKNNTKLTHLSLPRKRFVMQDHKDPRAFTIVERYEKEGSQK